MQVRFVPNTQQAEKALAEYAEDNEGSRAKLTTEDGREYDGSLVIDESA